MADIDLVKRNIGKMIDQGAPEADIDSYLGSEGVSVQQLRAGKEGISADVAKSAGIGVAKGGIGLGGAIGDIRSLASSATDYLGGKLSITPEAIEKFKQSMVSATPVSAALSVAPTSQDIQSRVEDVTGKFYKPRTTYGEYAQTGGEFASGALAGPGGLARRAVTQALIPAAASETAGQVTKGTAAEPYARIAAALTAGPAAARVVSPLRAQPGRQAMVDTLLAEGITPTAGQRSGSKALQYAESSLGDFPGAGGRATAAQEAAGQQFTSAALRRMGVEGPPTRANLDTRVQEMADTFRDLSARNVMNYDRGFVHDIQNTIQRYDRKLPSQQREVFRNYIDDLQQYSGGQIPGDVYQVARSDLSRQAHALRHNDPTLSEALRGVRNALDNAMNRSIAPADRAAWNEARRHWSNWRVLEGPAKNTDAAGNISISPQALQQAAAVRNRGQFARGQGDFAELAQAGVPILKPLPQSGTTPRAVAAGLFSAIGAGGAGIPGAIAGLAAPAAAGRALMSRPAQAYLRNQLMAQPDTMRERIIRALMANQSTSEPLRLTERP